jgi:hypothetical protein
MNSKKAQIMPVLSIYDVQINNFIQTEGLYFGRPYGVV